MTAAAFVALFFILNIGLGQDYADLSALSSIALLCLYAAIAIAVLKYRLYEIDIVISKAVLYGRWRCSSPPSTSAWSSAWGRWPGNRPARCWRRWRRRWWRSRSSRSASGPGGWPTGSCTAGGPRRTRCCRTSPSASAAPTATEDVLPQMAHIVAAGTGAEQVVVWLRVATSSARGLVGRQPEAARRSALAGDGLRRAAAARDGVPVVHQGELLGAISIQMPPGEPLRPAGEQLVADVASQAGLVLSNARLIEDLRASRQRLVTAQDESARRLERNIHDGAQQDLVALAIKLRLAAGHRRTDPAQAAAMLGELQAEAAGALENLRDLARGIYPPLLADLGLAAALQAQARKSPLPVTVEADGIGRFPPGHRGGRVLLLPGGAAEHRQIRPGVLDRGSAAGPGRRAVRRRSPTTAWASIPRAPAEDPACRTWPTGWPRSGGTWRSARGRARAPRSWGGSRPTPRPWTCSDQAVGGQAPARQSSRSSA